LMGGEPYRIMELTPFVGMERATSSVILYVMMHIFSHFLLWLSSVFIYVCFYPVSWEMGIVLGLITALCLFLGTLFVKGYRHGMAVACVRMGSHIPFLKHRVIRFSETHKEKLENIDKQIALLHQQKKSTFYSALFLEYLARIVSCLEVWLILNVLTTNVSFVSCILIVAFSSLLANLLFFLPMQLGGREGGFALAVGGLSLSGAYGVYAALITRVRELFWIVIGLALMKIGNKK
jgi:putative membrane protein